MKSLNYVTLQSHPIQATRRFALPERCLQIIQYYLTILVHGRPTSQRNQLPSYHPNPRKNHPSPRRSLDPIPPTTPRLRTPTRNTPGIIIPTVWRTATTLRAQFSITIKNPIHTGDFTIVVAGAGSAGGGGVVVCVAGAVVEAPAREVAGEFVVEKTIIMKSLADAEDGVAVGGGGVVGSEGVD